MRFILKSAVILMLFYSVFGSIYPERQNATKKFHAIEKKVNWFEALLTCRSQGMDLATIRNQQEQDQLENHLGAIYSRSDDSRWWLGGADLHKEGVFAWFSTGKAMNYTKFYEGEPSSEYKGEKEHCVELRAPVNWNYKWNNINCSYSQHFICEYFL